MSLPKHEAQLLKENLSEQLVLSIGLIGLQLVSDNPPRYNVVIRTNDSSLAIDNEHVTILPTEDIELQ